MVVVNCCSISFGCNQKQPAAWNLLCYVGVVFNGPVSLAGEFVKIKITRSSPLTLFSDLSE